MKKLANKIKRRSMSNKTSIEQSVRLIADKYAATDATMHGICIELGNKYASEDYVDKSKKLTIEELEFAMSFLSEMSVCDYANFALQCEAMMQNDETSVSNASIDDILDNTLAYQKFLEDFATIIDDYSYTNDLSEGLLNFIIAITKQQ